MDEEDAVVVRRPERHPREGWAEASRSLSAGGDDVLVWPEFGNEDDAKIAW